MKYFFHKRLIIKCKYKKNRWFKKPVFIQLSQGNLVIVQGLKPKKNKKKENTSEAVEILNIRNLTTKKDLVPTDQKVQKVQQRQFIKLKKLESKRIPVFYV